MNLKRARNYRRRLNRTTGLIKDNPVIMLGMALPYIIVPAASLKSAVVMSAFIFAATLPCAVISPLLGGRVKSVYAPPVYCIISMIFVMTAQFLLRGHAVILDTLGIYIPLAAINSIMVELAVINPRKSWGRGLGDAVLMCLGFAAACCLIGALREVFGSQTIWDIPFELYPVRLSGVALPFFGFIMIGFISALFRSVDRGITGSLLGGGSAPAGDEREGERA